MGIHVPVQLSICFSFLLVGCAAFPHFRGLSFKPRSREVHASASTTKPLLTRESTFLNQVEESIARVFQKYGDAGLKDLPPLERQSLSVASSLRSRLQDCSNCCRRCWLTPKYCVCDTCISLEDNSQKPIPKVRRLFLLMHHSEIFLKVDTAKLILAAFPQTCRLVVGGLSSEFQDSMREMEEAMKSSNCLVLFPSEDARTFPEIESGFDAEPVDGWDIIVIDGTWPQANKLHNRYVKHGPQHVKLSEDKVQTLASAAEGEKNGHQLRKHCIKWREVSTLEATRLFLGDMMIGSEDHPWDALATYQRIGDAAVSEMRR